MVNIDEAMSKILVFIFTTSVASALKYVAPQSSDSRTFAQYQKWNAETTGALTLDFKTSQSSSLLAYLDDGGNRDYLALQLDRGRMKLSFKLANYDIQFSVGENLNNSSWHTVKVFRNYSSCMLVVDSLWMDRESTDIDYTLTTKTDLYIGGLPFSLNREDITAKHLLNLDSYVGKVRNIFYKNDTSGKWTTPRLINSVGVEESGSDQCSNFNPCMNEGRCISSDRGSVCNCSQTKFSGEICTEVESVSIPSCPYEALCEPKKTAAGTFDGDAYFYYDLSKGDGINTQNDDITFEFRTQHPTGLIMGAVSKTDYIYIALAHGLLHVKFNLGSGSFDQKMGSQSLADNSWHRVNIRRTIQEVTITINDTLTEQGTTQGHFSTLSINSRFYVGGINTDDFGDVDNFRGNIRQLFYSGNIDLALLELAKANDPLITTFGDLVIGIEEVEESDPITFRTPESVLIVPKWDAEGKGILSFSFRTIEANGLLMYSMGSALNGDFFAVELFEGNLYVIINLGGGMTRSMLYTKKFNDASWHNVVITRMGVSTKVQVDMAEPVIINNRDKTNILNLEDDLFLGGVDNRENAKPLPMEVFSITRQAGYVGCMRNLVLNGLAYNIAGEAKQQNAEDIKPTCKSTSPMCKEGLCQNGGICSEGWNRFICDCSMTGYTGRYCSDNATVLSFNGNQTLLVDLGVDLQTKSEDITIRFQTYRPTSALLTIYTDNAVDVLKLELEGSQVKFTINFGERGDSSVIGKDVTDGEWHTIKLQRKQEELTVILDGGAEQVRKLNSTDADLNITTGEIGNLATKILDFRFVELGMNSRYKSTDSRIPFVGLIDQFIFNSRDYIELASGDPPNGMTVKCTASFSSTISRREIRNPVTFKLKSTFLMHPSPETYPSLSIFFHFRTMDPNGLLMFNRGDGNDFIAVEMVNGYLHYSYNFGEQPVTLRANTPGALNDNRWHEVYIASNVVTRFKVDNTTRSKSIITTLARRLDLVENIYLGGVERSKYNSLPESIKSRDGYHGCFASLEFNGHFRDLLTYAIPKYPDTVVRGCNARVNECTEDLCLNGGKCIEGWENIYCNCDATNYQGDRCEEAGTSYLFGIFGGLISLELTSEDWVSTEEDAITFGFATYSENAVLMRVESATQEDFIEINMNGGIIEAIYKLGPIAEYRIPTSPNKKFNDGLLHVVRFYRKGGNTTLIMDQIYNYGETVPASGATMFDNQGRIYIGGKTATEGRRKRRQAVSLFVGALSGVRLNKLKPLDLAATANPRVTILGNVTIIEDPTSFFEPPIIIPRPMDVKPITTTNNPVQNSPRENSDIFFPTIECNDDEECETTSGSGMDGVFVQTGENTDTTGKVSPGDDTSSSAIFSRVATTESVFICADDDEDCNIEEGSGATQDPFISMKNPTDSIITAIVVVNGDNSKPPSAGSNSKGNGTPTNKLDPSPGVEAQQSTFIEQTGMIIGIAAGGVVIMLLVILLLYKYRNRSEGSYKINESRNFDLQTVRASLLPTRNGTIPAKAPKSQLPPGYASKEWYV